LCKILLWESGMSEYKQHAMAGPSAWAIRRPAVAGTFYPADATECRRLASQFVQARPDETTVAQGFGKLCGGIVPHAGWICSGAIAGEAIAALAKDRPDAQVVVVFGAVHTPIPLTMAACDSHDLWQEPGAASPVASELRQSVLGGSRWFVVDDRFHAREHAVEVTLPLIQAAWPNAKVLPVEIPPLEQAVEIGRATAKAVIAAGLKPVYLASSDLTHYGPAYRFAPAGIGEAGLTWAMENDRRLLRVVTDMTPERVVPEVAQQHNACGPGAIAAMMAACMEHGATRAAVLRHANSFQTLARVAPQKSDNAVGYAAVVIG
jgi:MEMO1 family protein